MLTLVVVRQQKERELLRTWAGHRWIAVYPGERKEVKSLGWERARRRVKIWNTGLEVEPGSWNFLPVGSKKSWGWEKLHSVAGLFSGTSEGNSLAGLRTRVKITVPTSTPAHPPRNSPVATMLMERT